MKLLIVFALVVLAVYSTDARCHSHSDCSSFGANCATNHYLCALGTCHCTGGPTGQKCNTLADCNDCGDNYLGKHCRDQHCHCSLELGGGIGK